MFIQAIDHYLNSGKASAEEKVLLERVRNRRLAHRDFHRSLDDDASMGFVRIERATSAIPVTLFGQNAPSFAFNRIIVSLGRNDETGKRVPGEPVMSALISEESLAQLMLSTNQTSRHIGLTSESFLGEKLAPK